MKLCVFHSAAGVPVLVYLFFLFSFFLFCLRDVHCRVSCRILDFKGLVPIFFHNPFHMHRHTIFYLRQDLIVLLVVKIVGATRFSNVHKEANDIARKWPPQI